MGKEGEKGGGGEGERGEHQCPSRVRSTVLVCMLFWVFIPLPPLRKADNSKGEGRKPMWCHRVCVVFALLPAMVDRSQA